MVEIANAVAGENDTVDANGVIRYDVFSIPTPSAGEQPFTAPYVSTTLPLIITGPHTLANQSTTVELGVNSPTNSVDVTFDRPMNTNPAAGQAFNASDIVRITGPAGTVYDRAAPNAVEPAALTGGDVTAITVTTTGSGY